MVKATLVTRKGLVRYHTLEVEENTRRLNAAKRAVKHCEEQIRYHEKAIERLDRGEKNANSVRYGQEQ